MEGRKNGEKRSADPEEEGHEGVLAEGEIRAEPAEGVRERLRKRASERGQVRR